MDVFTPMRGIIPHAHQSNQSQIPPPRPAGVGKVSRWGRVANVDRAGDSIGQEKAMDRPTSRSPSRNLRKSKARSKAHARRAKPAIPTGVITRAQKLDNSRPPPKVNGAIAKIQKRVMWSVATRLQIIEAVTKVEEELLLTRSKEGVSRSVGRGVKKWSRVAELLSEEYRVHSQGPAGSPIGRFKCKSVFDHLIRGYKDKVSRRNRKSSHSLRLTGEEFELLKRREDNKARFLITAGKSSKQSLRTNSRSRMIKQSEEDLSDGHSLGSEPGQGSICSVTEQTSDSASDEAFEKLLQIDGNFERTGSQGGSHHIDDSEGKVVVIETTDELGDESERLESSLEKAGKDHEGPEKSTAEPFSCPNLEFESAASLSRSESNGSLHKAKCGSITKFKSQARNQGTILDINAATRQSESPSITTERKDTESAMIERAYDEDLRDILERPLHRVDMEFLHLSSWMLTEAIPFAERMMNVSASTAMSAKKRKANALRGPVGGSVTEAFEGFMRDSSNDMTEHQIRALFQKLRIRFAEELKDTCVEITKGIVEGAQV